MRSRRCRSTPRRRRSVLDEWDRIAIALENIEGPIAILNNVHPDKSVRDAADEAIRSLSIVSGRSLPERGAVRARAGGDARDAGAGAVQEGSRRSVRGHRRRAASRSARARQGDRRTDDGALPGVRAQPARQPGARSPSRPTRCAGLPESYLARQPRDDKGNYLLSYDYPDFNPFMANAESEPARRRYYIGYLNRGTARNLEILDEVVGAAPRDCKPVRPARASRTSCCGGGWRRRRRPSSDSSPTSRRPSKQAERNDLEELRALKAAREGTSVENDDRLALGRAVPQRAAARGALQRRSGVAAQVLPAGTRRSRGCSTSARRSTACASSARRCRSWHEDVFYYDVIDAENGAFIGGIYFDLYPREGKFPHAAAWPVRGVGAARRPHADQRAGGQLRSPRPDARRGRDALPRVRPHPARRALGGRPTTSTRARACSATSSKRRRRFSRSGRGGSRACSACAASHPTRR